MATESDILEITGDAPCLAPLGVARWTGDVCRPTRCCARLTYAESDLAVARGVDSVGARFGETLCFHAQQAAEKAVKAVLVAGGIEPSRTHDLARFEQLSPHCSA